MNKSDFERLDTRLVAYSDACARCNSAQQQLWGSLILLITEAIASECATKDFATREQIVAYVNAEVQAYYLSAEMKNRLPHGRHIHDGQIVFAVDTDDMLVHDAIKWAVICEVIQEVVTGKYALVATKRA